MKEITFDELKGNAGVGLLAQETIYVPHGVLVLAVEGAEVTQDRLAVIVHVVHAVAVLVEGRVAALTVDERVRLGVPVVEANPAVSHLVLLGVRGVVVHDLLEPQRVHHIVGP